MKSKLLVAAAAIAALSFAPAGRAQTAETEAPTAPVGPSGQRHPTVEVEPHFTTDFGRGFGIGFGARVDVTVLPRGIFTGLDDSLAVGAGVDWVRYGDCLDYRDQDNISCDHATVFWIPAVAQWNFFVTPRASIFIEGGGAIAHATYPSPCTTRDLVTGAEINIACSDTNDLHAVVAIGGRYKFAEHFSGTLRIGYPYFSIGASYL